MKRSGLIFLVFVLCMTSCQKSSPLKKMQSRELRIVIPSEPPSFDPRKSNDATAASLLTICYEGLFRLAEDGTPVFALADQMEVSEDGRTYRFHLRESFWQDGEPVTAYDFEETWKTSLRADFPSECAQDLYVLKNGRRAKENKCGIEEVGVKALSKNELLVELEHPIPYFLSSLATHSFFPTPNHITQIYPQFADNIRHFISNGPFKFSVWKAYDQLVLEKNQQYWDARSVKLTRVIFSVVPDEATALNMFENGEIDWFGSPFSALPADVIPALAKREQIFHYPISGTYYYIFNTTAFPMNNVDLRKALSLAIHRQEIVENITQAGQLPACALIPPTFWKTDRDYFHDADIEQARHYFQLALKEMHLTLDTFPTLTLSYNTQQTHHNIAQAVQQQWQKALGIHVKLENKEWKVYLDELRHGQFQIARMGGIASFADPISFLDLYRYPFSPGNYSEWCNAQFSSLLEEADLAIDLDQRTQLLKEAEKILIDEMPIAPIFFYTGTYLKKPYVKNVFPSKQSEADLKLAYLEGE